MKSFNSFWRQNQLWVYLTIPFIIQLQLYNMFLELPDAVVMGFTGVLGTLYLVLSLIPANLKRVFKKNKIIKKLTIKRREIGISAGLIFFYHSVFGINKYLDFGSGKLPSVEYQFGAISNYIFIFLLITSFFGIRAKWKKHWNLWHAMVWMTLPLILMHAGLNAKIYEGDFFSPIVIIYILLIIFSFLKSFLPNSFNKDDLTRDYAWSILGIILASGIVFANYQAFIDIITF